MVLCSCAPSGFCAVVTENKMKPQIETSSAVRSACKNQSFTCHVLGCPLTQRSTAQSSVNSRGFLALVFPQEGISPPHIFYAWQFSNSSLFADTKSSVKSGIAEGQNNAGAVTRLCCFALTFNKACIMFKFMNFCV